MRKLEAAINEAKENGGPSRSFSVSFREVTGQDEDVGVSGVETNRLKPVGPTLAQAPVAPDTTTVQDAYKRMQNRCETFWKRPIWKFHLVGAGDAQYPQKRGGLGDFREMPQAGPDWENTEFPQENLADGAFRASREWFLYGARYRILVLLVRGIPLRMVSDRVREWQAVARPKPAQYARGQGHTPAM